GEPCGVPRGALAGDPDAAVRVLDEGGQIASPRAAQADIEHIGARRGDATDQGRGQHRAGQAHVVTDHHRGRLHDFHIGAADAPRARRVEFVRLARTHIVGTKERIQPSHATLPAMLLPPRCGLPPPAAQGPRTKRALYNKRLCRPQPEAAPRIGTPTSRYGLLHSFLPLPAWPRCWWA